jgi:hypothetical protein
MSDYDDIRMKYKNRIKEQMGQEATSLDAQMFDGTGRQRSAQEIENIVSDEYKTFKEENLPKQLSIYEKMCNFSEGILKIKVSQKEEEDLRKYIRQCHLNITPTGAVSCSIVIPMLVAMFLLVTIQMLFFLFIQNISLFFIGFSFMLAAALMQPLRSYPEFAAQQWRLKSSSQMVQCVFYVVTYMRHTSNLEHAIDFASEHLNPPLAIDLKKVLWDVEMNRYSTIKESLDMYLEQWKEYNMEFVEAFHLIEASLFEGQEQRRIAMLDKSLDVILEGTFEKMLHYAQNLKGPITMLNMMGVIMPVLGLVILPLVVTFMDAVRWYHIAALYNILLPLMVYYMGMKTLATRPTGYGDAGYAAKKDPNYVPNYVKIAGTNFDIKPMMAPFMMFVMFTLLALSPLLIHLLAPDFDIVVMDGKFSLLEYRTKDDGRVLGPFGLGSTLLSLLLPLGLGLSIAAYNSSQVGNLMEVRTKTRKLEDEFSSAIFQLGNRIGDGLPVEIAVTKVGEVMRGTDSGNFFDIVTNNLRRMGLGVQDAIFHDKVGALLYYPSTMIRSSMKVLVQSARKGPQIASNALLNIARYVKEIHRVNERLKDLMAEVVGSINSQIAFLTPVIAGIVLGITSMISTIIGKLIAAIGCIGGSGGGLLQLMKDGVPSYYFVWVVGIYVVQISYILTIMMNSVENGTDALNEKYMLGQNLNGVMIKYTIIALGVILTFNFIAGNIVSGITEGC